MELRDNQLNAINVSISNDFQSGVHFQATGAGKSLIAFYLIKEYNAKYPKNNVLLLCEKKNILIQQFNKSNETSILFRGLTKQFNVLNYSDNKIKNWTISVNSSKYWSKPCLLIINRAYLTFNSNYNKINLKFDLIIHDECHTLNNTTKQFYDFINNLNPDIKCIGFSATPNLNTKYYNNILSNYSIYNAFIDGIIVPPKIKWFSCQNVLTYEEYIELSIPIIENELVYKKIIIWCGMIDATLKNAELFSQISYFNDYLICIDTSLNNSSTIGDYNNLKYYDFNAFNNANSKALLFCACKHREGTDIKNLDCCMFLDKVETRTSQLFIQSIGRVLRTDKTNTKKYGVIIDIKAKSSYYICKSINNYLNIPENIYPWNYYYETINYNNKFIKINTLELVENNRPLLCNNNNITNDFNDFEKKYNRNDLIKYFIRELPNNTNNTNNYEVYKKRLDYELYLLEEKNLIIYLLQALEILEITKSIPHVTRGSCGSSLVCYLLGISHIDPIKNNIKFARFLNEYRNNLPDIDLDFPHNLREEVFLKIEQKWPGKIAMISNHVYFHDKSALRKAFRNAGINKFIAKDQLQSEFNKLPNQQREFIKNEKNKLINTFNCYSLHCGGIVLFPNGIPRDIIINQNNNKYPLAQIKLNKHNIASDKNFKIDILSSRALSQCFEINNYQLINFEEFNYDEKTFSMLHAGDNIGITLAESPLMRQAFMKIKPTTLYDLAVCLSIIRPSARDARLEVNTINENENENENTLNSFNNLTTRELNNKFIIFDDDAIDLIENEFNLSEADADKYRRGFAKGSKEVIEEFRKIISHETREKQRQLMKKLHNLSSYGFCKAHAFSYAQLIWKLAYMKAHYPYEFWKATLNNNESSYRKWVHYYEAKLAGVNIHNIMLKRNDVSIYANVKKKKLNNLSNQNNWLILAIGLWIMMTSFLDVILIVKIIFIILMGLLPVIE